MGNEVSKPETPSGRARSLSPLPRDDLLDGVDDLPPFPSTMPASVATTDLRPRLSGSPEGQPWPIPRDGRSRSPSPESTIYKFRSPSPDQHQPRLHSTQPAQPVPRSGSPDQSARPASQPEPSRAKKSRPSKRRSSGIKVKNSQQRDAEHEQDATADSGPVEETAVPNNKDASSNKKGKRHSTAGPRPADRDADLPLDGPNTTAVDGDSNPGRGRSQDQHKSNKKNKEKGKEAVATDVAGPSIFDFNDEPPPSAQALGQSSPPDSKPDPAALAGDVTHTQDRPLDQQSSNKKDKGKGRELAPNGGGPSIFDFDDEPPPGAQALGKRARRDSSSRARKKRKTPQPPSEGLDEAVKAEPADELVDFSNLPSHTNSGNAEHDTLVAPPPAPQPDLAMDVDVPQPDKGQPDPLASEANEADEAGSVSTPPASSIKRPGSRHSSKRKAKAPFSDRQQEENANAFSELPLDEAADPPRSRHSKPRVSQSAAEAEAGPSNVSGPPERTKPKKQAATGTAATDNSDNDPPAETSRYRSGPLSRTEQDQIVRAVERFREDEDLAQEEINRIIHENPQKSGGAIHRQLWASIQDACPTRPRQKLINWCRQRFHNFAGRGTWTREQDDELAHLIEIHGRKWSLIAGLINRHQKDVRDRWRNYLVCRDSVKTDKWSEDEEEQLREVVERSLEKIQTTSGQRTNKPPEHLINWLKVSEEMGYTRSRLQCMEKWKRLRAAEPVPDKVPTVLPPGDSWRLRKARKDLQKMTVHDKYLLMCAVRDSAVGTDSKIDWKHIVTRVFDGKYERQALIVAWGRLRQAVPRWEWKTTRDCARYLCEMYEKEGHFGTVSDGEIGDPEGDAPDQASSRSAEDDASDQAPSRLVEGSPELGSEPTQQSSPSVEAEASRSRSAAERRSPKGKDKEMRPPTPQERDKKVSKRARRESLVNGDARSPRSKKRKTGEPSAASRARVNGVDAGNTSGRAESSANAHRKAGSVMSSDMDDMEDIPATLPTSSQAAH